MLAPEEIEVLEYYYQQEYKDMFKFAYRLLKDEHIAEVAVQDTFLIASNKIKKLCDSPNPRGWLYNTLKNAIRHLQRERQRMLERCVDFDSAQEPFTEMPPIASLDISKNADLQMLAQFYVNGYSLEEIAAHMGISVPAVKMRINRAKKRLRANPEIKNLRNF